MIDLALDGGFARELDTLMGESYDSASSKESSNKTRLPLAVVELLLDKLAHDDDYRALFQQNPIAALELVGATDTSNCSDCGDRLPSKEVIQQTRATLLLQITSMASMAVFKR